MSEIPQDERDRAAWALCVDDCRRTPPRVSPAEVWPRVSEEYRRRAGLALVAAADPAAPLPPEWGAPAAPSAPTAAQITLDEMADG